MPHFAEGFDKKANLIKSNESDKEMFISLSSKEGGYTKEQALSMLHLSSIAHILFPENFPKPEMIKEGENGKYEVVMEYIPHDELHSEINKDRVKNAGSFSEKLVKRARDREVELNVEAYRKKFNEAGLLFVVQDMSGVNLLKVDDELVHIDMSPAIIENDLAFDPRKLKKYINSLNNKIVSELCQLT